MIGTTWCATRAGAGTLYNGLYGKALPKRDTFLEFRYMKGQGLHMKGFGKSVIADCERTYKD